MFCSATLDLLHKILDLIKEIERTGYNIDDNTITEATLTLMVETLNHMSERACGQIISNPTLSTTNQHDAALAHPHGQNMNR